MKQIGGKMKMDNIKNTLKMGEYIQVNDMCYFIPKPDSIMVSTDNVNVDLIENTLEISKTISCEEFIKTLTEDEILSIESQDDKIIFNVKTDKKFI